MIKSADETKLGGFASILETRIQGDIDELEN